MKKLFVIVTVMLLLVYTIAAQDCIRQETTAVQVKVNNWCNNQPASAVLPTPLGYCANVKCKSSHRTHYDTGGVKRGKYACTIQKQLFCKLKYFCCRML